MANFINITDHSHISSDVKKYTLNSFFFIFSFWFLNQVASLFVVAEGVSIFYPPSGFAMLLIYLFGPRYLPIHFIAIIIGGFPQRDVFNYDLGMLYPDLRQFIIYAAAGLILAKVNPNKKILNATFFYFLILVSIATSILSSIIFAVNFGEVNGFFNMIWPESAFSLFVGNFTGTLTALPIFMFYLHVKAIGWAALKSDVRHNIFRYEKVIVLFIILVFTFSVIFIGKINNNFSSYYYFILIPIIWTSVKWGLGIGLMYAFVGNIISLAVYVLFGGSSYGVVDIQIMFSMSIISTILVGLVHEQKDIFYKESMYDGLTGLANMKLFKKLSHSMIASAKRNRGESAFLFIDIDGFKIVNDTFGHKVGDDLLRQISELIKSCIRNSDSVARYGGDEFIIQLEGNTSEKGAETVALNIIERVSRPLHFDNGVATVGASVGISMYPRDGTDIDTLISKADRAMYVAKTSGKNCYRLYRSPLT